MKASELRPGQFFQYLGTRCMLIGSDEFGVVIAYKSKNGFVCPTFREDVDVTPLNVHDWDDEPQREPAPRPCDSCGKKPATCFGTYEGVTGYSCDDCCGHGCEDGHCDMIVDLIAEVPPPSCPNKLGSANCPTLCEPCKKEVPPVEPEQFKAGDWLVCLEKPEGADTPDVGDVLMVTSVSSCNDKFVRFFGNRTGHLPSCFRRATPAEIAAHEQSIRGLGAKDETPPRPAVQPDADGWIEWKGGECPVDEGVLIDVRFRDGCERLNSSSYNTCKTFWLDENNPADIVAYRLVQQPAPITHWVEVVGL